MTDGVRSFAVFTYNCNRLQWSGLFGQEAVIGVNVGVGIDGDFRPFENHPLSGLPQSTMVACTNVENGIEWSDVIYKIGDVTSDQQQQNRAECMSMYRQDIERFGPVSEFPNSKLSNQLSCPCSLFQAAVDFRFRFNFLLPSGRSSETFCYFNRFIQLVSQRFVVQECCYSTQINS